MKKNMKGSLVLLVTALTIFVFASASLATNGYFSHGYSVKNKGLAGVNTALPLDSEAASSNPAGMAFVGSRIDFGLSFFNPNRKYTVKGSPSGFPGTSPLQTGTVESDSKWFYIPSLGVNWMLDDKSSIGLSIYGNGGMNTDYDTATYPGGSSPTGVDMAQMFVVPSYAAKIFSNHAIGIGIIGAYQIFEANGLKGFAGFSQDGSALTDNGHDTSYGYGARIGYLGELVKGFFVGASYQTRIYMNEFDDYSGLFAEQGDFDIPENWSIGVAYKPVENFTMAFDIQKIYYSRIASVGNSFNPAFNTCAGAVMTGGSASRTDQCLGGDDGVGFGWRDMTIFKLGTEWQSSPDWTWRAGFSHGRQPIPDSEVLFNIVAPGVIETHITGGATKALDDHQELNLAVMYAFSKKVSGPNPLDPGQTIELEMHQWEFTGGYSWKF